MGLIRYIISDFQKEQKQRDNLSGLKIIKEHHQMIQNGDSERSNLSVQNLYKNSLLKKTNKGDQDELFSFEKRFHMEDIA